jgi:hypothetical protein
VKNPSEMIRLWMHEADRVYRDKLVDEEDISLYDKIMKDVYKKSFEVRFLKTLSMRHCQWVEHMICRWH